MNITRLPKITQRAFSMGEWKYQRVFATGKRDAHIHAHLKTIQNAE